MADPSGAHRSPADVVHGRSLSMSRTAPLIVALGLVLALGSVLFRRRAEESKRATDPEDGLFTRGIRTNTGAPGEFSRRILTPGEGEVGSEPRFGLPAASTEARRLVRALVELGQAEERPDQQRLDAWKAGLAALKERGLDGVAAISEFLLTKEDRLFGPEVAGSLGAASMRLALFEVLRGLGGGDAEKVLAASLRGNEDPRELSRLARILEVLAPGRYGEEILPAARRALIAVESRAEGSGIEDVGGLFAIYQRYGDSTDVAELSSASEKWQYYGVMALAGLRDDVGVGALVQIAQRESGARGNLAWELLAQSSGQSEAARELVLAQTKAGAIPASAWSGVGSVLSGEEYHFADDVWWGIENGTNPGSLKVSHIAASNQTFYLGPGSGGADTEFLESRLRLVESLLGCATAPEARNALEGAKRTLVARLDSLRGNADSPAP